jgi:hypothetical protein
MFAGTCNVDGELDPDDSTTGNSSIVDEIRYGGTTLDEAISGVTVFIALPKLLVISSKPSLFT